MTYERKILVIDDDSDINNYLKLILKKNDFITESSTEMKDFFQKVMIFKPHLCIVDLNIGEYDGVGFKIVEMLRKKIGNDIIVLVMSRRDSIKDINKALEMGANDYIQKPIDDQILISKINLFLGKNNEDNDFPFYAVPTGDMDCDFNVPMRIYSVSEDYIKVFSKNYIAKGTYLNILDGILKNYKFAIKEVTLDRDNGGYILRFDLDEIEHGSLYPLIRKIIINTPPRD